MCCPRCAPISNASKTACVRSARLRFKGQDFEISVALPETVIEGGRVGLHAAFCEAYKAIYCHTSDDSVEIVKIGLSAGGNSGDRLAFRAHKSEDGARNVTTRKVYF